MSFFIKLLSNKRWLSGCLLVFISACNQSSGYNALVSTHEDSLQTANRNLEARKMIAGSKWLIHAGDVITRTGNDFTSESLRQFSEKDKTYSHCGIASIEHDSIFVYHALGGEFNPDQKLRRDPIETFCSPIENRGFGIFSFDFDQNQLRKLDSVVHDWHNKGKMFDMDFSLATDERLYCAEFVAKAISTASAQAISFDTSHIKDFNFFAVDNLILNKHCREKKRVRF